VGGGAKGGHENRREEGSAAKWDLLHSHSLICLSISITTTYPPPCCCPLRRAIPSWQSLRILFALGLLPAFYTRLFAPGLVPAVHGSLPLLPPLRCGSATGLHATLPFRSPVFWFAQRHNACAIPVLLLCTFTVAIRTWYCPSAATFTVEVRRSRIGPGIVAVVGGNTAVMRRFIARPTT